MLRQEAREEVAEQLRAVDDSLKYFAQYLGEGFDSQGEALGAPDGIHVDIALGNAGVQFEEAKNFANGAQEEADNVLSLYEKLEDRGFV